MLSSAIGAATAKFLIAHAAIAIARSVMDRPERDGLNSVLQLLPVQYFHVVFTVPHLLAPLALPNQRVVYGIRFRAAAETLLQIAADPRHLGARLGFLAVLHTWGQNLHQNPHS
jgi:hypothetical protein